MLAFRFENRGKSQANWDALVTFGKVLCLCKGGRGTGKPGRGHSEALNLCYSPRPEEEESFWIGFICLISSFLRNSALWVIWKAIWGQQSSGLAGCT